MKSAQFGLKFMQLMYQYSALRPITSISFKWLSGFLFNNQENEILDVDGNHGFTKQELDLATRIQTLDEHRKVLKDAFTMAGRDKSVLVIVSPWITCSAIISDKVDNLCREAVSHDAQIHVIVDKERAKK